MTTMRIKAPTQMGRLAKVLRLNFANPWSALIIPLIIIGILMAATYTLEALRLAFMSADGEVMFSPEVFLIIFLLVIANQTIYHHFPIALSYGISRRDFYIGSLIGFTGLAIWYAVLTMAIGAIRGTYLLAEFSSVGIQDFFSLIWAFLAVQLVGASITTIYLRWGKIGMFVFFGTVAAILISLPIVITNLGNWDAFLRLQGVDLLPIEAFAISTVVAGLIATAGYLIIRRARVL